MIANPKDTFNCSIANELGTLHVILRQQQHSSCWILAPCLWLSHGASAGCPLEVFGSADLLYLYISVHLG